MRRITHGSRHRNGIFFLVIIFNSIGNGGYSTEGAKYDCGKDFYLLGKDFGLDFYLNLTNLFFKHIKTSYTHSLLFWRIVQFALFGPLNFLA